MHNHRQSNVFTSKCIILNINFVYNQCWYKNTEFCVTFSNTSLSTFLNDVIKHLLLFFKISRSNEKKSPFITIKKKSFLYLERTDPLR